MQLLQRFPIWLALLLGGLPLAAAPKANTTAELWLAADAARPGDTVLAGVRLRMAKGWHTYWKNSGESGAPIEIHWQLPAGLTAGDVRWPAPERYEAEELTTFVLHDEVVLLVPLTLAKDVAPGTVELKAEVSWLECEKLCVPGDATVTATLRIGDAAQPSAHAGALAAAGARAPRDGAALRLRAVWDGPATGDTRALLLRWPARAGITQPDFFPEAGEGYEVALKPQAFPVSAGELALRLTVKTESNRWPTSLRGVLAQTAAGTRETYAVEFKPAESDAPAPAPGLQHPAAPGGVAKFLLLALLGGLILNLMPCVLPILSLKVLHLVQQRDATAAQARRDALLYTLGVLVSFWALAGLVLAGRLGSWGEQFQDPRFVVVMTVLMTLVALNLFGVFEIILPGAATSKAGELAARGGAAGAFFNGVLAVVLGASCVAPVLAAAVGWAIRQPPLLIVLAFSCIGLGLALPFLAMSFVPALRRVLPKPGAWMETFKLAMGFPMLATAAWLLAQTGDHYGNGGPLWVGLFLVLLALAAWVYGEFHQRGSRRRGTAMLIALLIAAAGYGWTLERELNWRTPPAATSAATPGVERVPGGIDWQPWSTEAVAAARATGRPVLVDFTANWCLTCQLNKKTSLEVDSVRARLKAVNAVALLGDYTRKNPAITAELQRFERAGVPLVLVYPKDAAHPPEILPTVLTPEIVLDALTRAAK